MIDQAHPFAPLLEFVAEHAEEIMAVLRVEAQEGADPGNTARAVALVDMALFGHDPTITANLN
jgi:hypothetical protein